jgi:FSR family fosmidomycin resistance protein-like MFS transporter
MMLGRRPNSIAPPTASSNQVGLRQMLGITAGHAANDVFVSFLAPLLPLFIARLGLTHAEAGLLSLVKETPSLLQPVIGHWADRLNLRVLSIAAPTITAVLISLTGSARSYLMLALLLWLAGLSSAAFHSVTPAIAGQLSASSAMGRSMGLWIFGGELGFALGPLLVVTVVERFGLVRMPYLSVMGLAGTVVLLFSLRDLRAVARSSHASPTWVAAVHSIRPILGPLLALGSVDAGELPAHLLE